MTLSVLLDWQLKILVLLLNDLDSTVSSILTVFSRNFQPWNCLQIYCFPSSYILQKFKYYIKFAIFHLLKRCLFIHFIHFSIKPSPSLLLSGIPRAS